LAITAATSRMLGIVSNVGVLVADTFLIVAVGLNNRLNQTFAKYSVRAEVISVDPDTPRRPASLRTCVATSAGTLAPSVTRASAAGCALADSAGTSVAIKSSGATAMRRSSRFCAAMRAAWYCGASPIGRI
jgi:hypothetical protein